MVSHVEEEKEKEAGTPFTEARGQRRGGVVTTIRLCREHRVLPVGVLR